MTILRHLSRTHQTRPAASEAKDLRPWARRRPAVVAARRECSASQVPTRCELGSLSRAYREFEIWFKSAAATDGPDS